jgi:hypothetical protein
MVCDRFVCRRSLSAPFLMFISRLFTTVCLYLSRFIVLKAYISRDTKIYLLCAQHFQSSTIRNDWLFLTDCIAFTCHSFNSYRLLSRLLYNGESAYPLRTQVYYSCFLYQPHKTCLCRNIVEVMLHVCNVLRSMENI